MAQPGRIEGGRLGFAQGFSNLIASRRHDADLRAAQRLQKETLGAMFEPVLVPVPHFHTGEVSGQPGKYEYSAFTHYTYTLGYRLNPGRKLTPALLSEHPEVFPSDRHSGRVHIYATTDTRVDYFDIRLGTKVSATRTNGYYQDGDASHVDSLDPSGIELAIGRSPQFERPRPQDANHGVQSHALDRVVVTVPFHLTHEQALRLHLEQGYQVDTIAMDAAGISNDMINNATPAGMLNLVALRDSDAPAFRRIR